jgi:hypothetical protein
MGLIKSGPRGLLFYFILAGSVTLAFAIAAIALLTKSAS